MVEQFNVDTGAAGTNYDRSHAFPSKALLALTMGYPVDYDIAATWTPRRSIGFAASTSSRWMACSQSVYGAGTSATDKMQRADAILGTLTTAGALEALLDVTNMSGAPTRFTVDDAFVDAIKVGLAGIGGADIQNVAVGGFDQATGTGDNDITTVGFQPDFVLCISPYCIAPEPDIRTGSAIMVSACDAALNQWVCGTRALDAAGTSDTGRYMRKDQFIGVITTAAGLGTCLVRASLTAMLSNGFRLNYIETDATVRRFGYLAIKGGKWRVGNVRTVNDTSTPIVASPGFKPVVGMLVSTGAVESTDDTPTAHDAVSIGMFTGVAARATYGQLDQDALATTDTSIFQESDETYCRTGISASGVLDSYMDITAVGPKGFDSLMELNHATLADIGYWVAGSNRRGIVGAGMF